MQMQSLQTLGTSGKQRTRQQSLTQGLNMVQKTQQLAVYSCLLLLLDKLAMPLCSKFQHC